MYRYTPKKTLDMSLKMAGSNILPRKQLKKTNDQLTEFAMKLLNNMITKSTELINNNKEFGEKLSVTDSKHGKLKKMNEILKSKVSIPNVRCANRRTITFKNNTTF